MPVDAYILPVPGASTCVIAWGDRRRRPGETRGAGTSSAASSVGAVSSTGGDDTLSVYAPGPLSEGELSEVAGRYIAALGSTLFRSGSGGAIKVWWWVIGIVVLALLVLQSSSGGLPAVWITAAAAFTALPLRGSSAADGPSGGARSVARRQARRVQHLTTVTGGDAREQERLTAIWRVAQRQRGSELALLRAMEAHCAESRWQVAAAFYRDRISQRFPAAEGGPLRRLKAMPGVASLLRLVSHLPGSKTPPAYATLEMRSW